MRSSRAAGKGDAPQGGAAVSTPTGVDALLAASADAVAGAAAASAPEPVVPGWAMLDASPLVAPRAWERLVAIARRLQESYPPVVHGVVSQAEIEGPLLRVCLGVRAALGGDQPTVADSQSLLPLRPLVDAVRRAFVAEGAALVADGGSDEFLAVLAALERVLATVVDDSAQRFAERMAEGDAMHLVVEVAHDMRSPLSSILFLAERIRKGQSGPVPRRDHR